MRLYGLFVRVAVCVCVGAVGCVSLMSLCVCLWYNVRRCVVCFVYCLRLCIFVHVCELFVVCCEMLYGMRLLPV